MQVQRCQEQLGARLVPLGVGPRRPQLPCRPLLQPLALWQQGAAPIAVARADLTALLEGKLDRFNGSSRFSLGLHLPFELPQLLAGLPKSRVSRGNVGGELPIARLPLGP